MENTKYGYFEKGLIIEQKNMRIYFLLERNLKNYLIQIR